MKVQFKAPSKCAIKTGSGIVLSGRYLQVTEEQMK